MRNKPEPSPLHQALVDIAVAEDYSERMPGWLLMWRSADGAASIDGIAADP